MRLAACALVVHMPTADGTSALSCKAILLFGKSSQLAARPEAVTVRADARRASKAKEPVAAYKRLRTLSSKKEVENSPVTHLIT
jgi:hypothetical protein